jgi:hypothetical protein
MRENALRGQTDRGSLHQLALPQNDGTPDRYFVEEHLSQHFLNFLNS